MGENEGGGGGRIVEGGGAAAVACLFGGCTSNTPQNTRARPQPTPNPPPPPPPVLNPFETFRDFMTAFPKVYRTAAEQAIREQNFNNNLRRVNVS